MNLVIKKELGCGVLSGYIIKHSLIVLFIILSALSSMSVTASSLDEGQRRAMVVDNAGMSMHKKMLDIEKRVKALQTQMKGIQNNANLEERHRLLLLHIRSTRQTIDVLRGMELRMESSQKAGEIISEPQLLRRQAVSEQLMDMILAMVEQIVLLQDPALNK